MAVRASFENNCEIGCFAKLTNTYCLVAIGGSENFYRCVGRESGPAGIVWVGGGEKCLESGAAAEGGLRPLGSCAHRAHVSTVYSRESWPIPFPWFTRPSPAAASSAACVWVSWMEDAEGGRGASQRLPRRDP